MAAYCDWLLLSVLDDGLGTMVTPSAGLPPFTRELTILDDACDGKVADVTAAAPGVARACAAAAAAV